jgi:NDP-sugar pyrophosphorylase family protein
MRAVVMAGGRGTRMLPYTTVLPKPLLPVGNRPILALLLDQLSEAGITHVDLCLGYLGELIRAYLTGAPPTAGIELAYHHELEPLGTAGPLRMIGGLDAPFLSLNGDVLTSLDFGALLDDHKASGAALTIAVQQRHIAIGSGVLEIHEGRVTAYTEKPVLSHVVSLGIYAWDPRSLTHLEKGYTDIPTLVDKLLAAGELVRAYHFSGAWFDIGTPEEHQAAAADFAASPERYLSASR